MRPRFCLLNTPAFSATLIVLEALMLASPAQAAPGSLGDFRLPPDQDAPADEPAPQGPVAPDVPASTRVTRPVPTTSAAPTPASTASPVVQPLPSSSATPRIVVPSAAPSPAARATPTNAPQPRAARTVPAAPSPSPSPDAELSSEPIAPPTPASSLPLPAPPLTTGSELEEGSASDGVPWLWLGLTLLILAALGSGVAFLRRRTGGRASATVPEIERPVPIPAAPAAEPAAAPADTAPPTPMSGAALELELEPQRLSLTLMNATLSYRLLLNNRGAEPLESLSITADMIAAHAALSREQQLSGPDAQALQVASIERLEPGESRIVSGEFRLPFSQIMPVRQGNATLLFPLARFRVEGAKANGAREPLIRTFLVAQPPQQPGAGLQPFRLDLGPRIYSSLAQRAFA